MPQLDDKHCDNTLDILGNVSSYNQPITMYQVYQYIPIYLMV